MPRDNICTVCNEPSKVEPSGSHKPDDMIFCEGLAHEESRLVHMDCCIIVDVTGFKDNEFVCPDCAKYYREHVPQ